MSRVAVAPSSKAGGVLGARVTVTLYVWGVVVPSEAVTTMVIKFCSTSSGTDAPL